MSGRQCHSRPVDRRAARFGQHRHDLHLKIHDQKCRFFRFLEAGGSGLFPVTRIEGRHVGDGTPGPIIKRLLNIYYKKQDEGWMLTSIDPE